LDDPALTFHLSVPAFAVLSAESCNGDETITYA
jgi:hypothetical protein